MFIIFIVLLRLEDIGIIKVGHTPTYPTVMFGEVSTKISKVYVNDSRFVPRLFTQVKLNLLQRLFIIIFVLSFINEYTVRDMIRQNNIIK